MLLLPEGARIIGQGITGSEGQSGLSGMVKYGTNIVAGVTPGKGGQNLNGIPIFNTVKEAVAAVGEIDGTVQYVPPIFAKDATVEALEAGIKFVLVFSERVPTYDAAIIYATAQKFGASVVGPSSMGMISPHRKLKVGSIGGNTPERVFVDGNIAVISKSGGMSSEMGLLLKNNGLGVSWAVGIGGDRIMGTDFGDLLIELEQDEHTRASVIFGELGGTYEERVSSLVKEGKVKKPVIAFIAGEFTMSLPSEVQFGHAGAIIEGERSKPDYKRRVLRAAGVKVAEDFDQIVDLLKEGI